jgi:UDPglucose 6-dehydrogenase
VGERSAVGVIGIGWVGLVTAACFAELGNEVVALDIDEAKVAALRRGEVPIHEPGLAELVERNRDRLRYVTAMGEVLNRAELLFCCVDTPPTYSGDADLSRVRAVVEQLQPDGRRALVMKSTVPAGTGETIRRELPGLAYVSCPEFLKEGTAVADFMHPDRVVIGIGSDRAREVMRQIYRPLFLRETPILFTKLETSELIKYSANAFLAMKITFINQVSDLCEKVGADVHDVARGIGLDGRIGNKFLHPSPGFGGSCFPKDTRALIQTARDAGSPLSLIEATLDFNEARKREMAERILAALGPDPKGKTAAVLGLTFKPNTDDMREAASVTILPILTEKGVKVRAHDPEGMHEAKKQLPNLDYCEDAYATMKDADVLVILTEWNSYRSLDLERVKSLLKAPIFIDLRNIYRPDEMAAAGFRYSSLGRAA